MDVVEKVNRAAHFLIRNLWKAAVHWMCQRGNLVCGPLHYTVAVDSSHIVHLDSGRRTVLNLVPLSFVLSRQNKTEICTYYSSNIWENRTVINQPEYSLMIMQMLCKYN